MNINGQKVIVVGTGKSGIGSAVLLEQNGALPILYDGKDRKSTRLNSSHMA